MRIWVRCNQRCVFCFEEDRPWAEPDGAEARRILEQARGVSDEAILMGGEALMRPDILDLLAYARGIGLRLAAFTNGRVLAREGFLDDLARAGLEGVVVSANYADAESFSRGTRLPAPRFEEFLQALDRVRAFQAGPLAAAMPIGFEAVEAVLSRLPAPPPGDFALSLLPGCQALSFPEGGLAALLSGQALGGVAAPSLTVDRHPLLCAIWRGEQGELRLDVGFGGGEGAGAEGDDWLVGALRLRFGGELAVAEDERLALLRALADEPVATTAHWGEGLAGLPVVPGRPEANAALWARFGERLWPGVGRFGEWSVLRAALCADGGLTLRLGDERGRRALLVLYAAAFASPTGPSAATRLYTSDSFSLDLLLEEDPVGEVLAAHEAMAALADLLCEIVAPPRPQAVEEASPAPVEEGLRLRFREQEGLGARVWDFRVAPAEAGREALASAGGWAISHLPCDTGPPFDEIRRLLVKVAGRMPAPSGGADASGWRQVVQALLARSAIGDRVALD